MSSSRQPGKILSNSYFCSWSMQVPHDTMHRLDVEVVERVGDAVEQHAVVGDDLLALVVVACRGLRIAAAQVAGRQHASARRRDRASPASASPTCENSRSDPQPGSRTPRPIRRPACAGSRMIGTIGRSSMSSSARAVRFGKPPGIGLLMKWITCAIERRPADASPADARSAPRARPRPLRARGKREALQRGSPDRSSPLRSLIVVGSVAFRNEHRALACPDCTRRLPCWRSRLRIAIETSPKSMSTGHGFAALVADRAVVGDVARTRRSAAATRRAASAPRTGSASISSDVARILLRGLYSRFARGTCVAHGGLHLPQRRQSLIESAMPPDLRLLEDQALGAEQAEARRVGSGQIGDAGQQLARLKRPAGIDPAACTSTNGASSSAVRYSSLVMPMPCSPEMTPPRRRASAMMRATAALACCSIA